ncbi:TonB-dependent receptor plug domain-containing protein [candidate division KSB1 bacterium]|nr:TonB-dependent receptor plug domain-containing protein [candidate division KSB1 bacterium]
MEYRFKLRLLMTGLVCFSLDPSAFGGMGKAENQPVKNFTITGTVVDVRTGKPLDGANVQLTLVRTGASSDSNGRFELFVSRNRMDTLLVSFIGYQQKKIPIVVPLKQPIIVALQPMVLPMPAVSVSGERFDREHRLFAMDPSVQRISHEDIKTTPFVLAPDLYRALQKLPGVTSNNETSPQLSVRGGNTDQNLVLIDGAPVYYPYHLLGLASAFNPDTFEDIYFSLGGFSAAYGGKLSSVLSLDTREPQKDFPHRINLSLTGGDITTGGKMSPSVGWLFSGRLCYLNLLNRLNIGYPYEFYDGLFKMNFQPGRGHKISFTVF